MFKRFGVFALIVIMAAIVGGCGSPLPSGTLSGAVVRQGSNEPIPNPYVIIGRVLKSPLAPDEVGQGDKDGKFLVTVSGGNYVIQIGTSEEGPFYKWPDIVYVEPEKVTQLTFTLPSGF